MDSISFWFLKNQWKRNRFESSLIVSSQIFHNKGLDQKPDLFPGSQGSNHYGSWLRLPGLHHTREHYTRVWNDEPYADTKWLEGHEAIDRITSLVPASFELLEQHGMPRKRRTICLDFDGVVHSYQTGWHGETIISDPPIHRVDQAINRLRKDFRVVVFSARCRSDEGVQAIKDWLTKHNIEVDDVCRGQTARPHLCRRPCRAFHWRLGRYDRNDLRF